MNKLIVRINGHEYTMVGNESKDYLIKVADYVDEQMQVIIKANPKLSTTMAAVLTSLNIADELFKCSYELDEVNSKYKKPLQDLDDANTTVSDLRTSIDSKESKIESLKSKIEIYIEEINNLKKEKEKIEVLLEEKNQKLLEAEEIADDFQNRLYDIQMKMVELEKKE